MPSSLLSSLPGSLLSSLFFSLLLVLGTASPTPMQKHGGGSGADAPALTENPAITSLALKIYQQMRSGKVDQSLLTPAMNKALSPEVLTQNKPIFDQLGDPDKLTFESGQKLASLTHWVYTATFPTAQMHVEISIDSDGKVAGYQLAP